MLAVPRSMATSRVASLKKRPNGMTLARKCGRRNAGTSQCPSKPLRGSPQLASPCETFEHCDERDFLAFSMIILEGFSATLSQQVVRSSSLSTKSCRAPLSVSRETQNDFAIETNARTDPEFFTFASGIPNSAETAKPYKTNLAPAPKLASHCVRSTSTG